MEQLKSSDEVVLEPVPDKLLPSQITHQVMETLKQSDEAAFRVWILLATRFGAGQKL